MTDRIRTKEIKQAEEDILNHFSATILCNMCPAQQYCIKHELRSKYNLICKDILVLHFINERAKGILI
jgi:hypothetical protein